MSPRTRPAALRPVRAALALLALAVPLAAAPLGAQIIPDSEDVDEDAQAAYFALSTTPVGALPPTAATGAFNLGPRTLGFRFHVSQMELEQEVTTRAFAGGLDIPLGTATLGLTAGYVDLSCDLDVLEEIEADIDAECKGAIMGGANIAFPLVGAPMGAAAATPTIGNTLSIGLDVAVGYSSGEYLKMELEDPDFGTLRAEMSANSLAAAVSLPVGFVVRNPGVVIVPHLRPAIGYGSAKLKFEATGEPEESDTFSGMRFMLGGGLGLRFPQRAIGLDVGFQKVFVDDGEMAIGLGVTFGR